MIPLGPIARHSVAALALLASFAIPAAGQLTDGWAGWSAYWENDSFAGVNGSDDAFTNGIRLVFQRDPDEPLFWTEALEDRARSDRWLFHPLEAGSAVVFGNNFFTPRVITDYTPEPADRPFVGWMYVGARWELTSLRPPSGWRPRGQHAFEVNVGVLGPPALAEHLQSGIHAGVTTHRIPKGWEEQIGAEPGLSVQYMLRGLWGGSIANVTLHGGGLVGTPQIYPYAGVVARLGWGMTGFPALIGRNTVVPPSLTPGLWEFGVLAGVEGRWMVRNAFVEGGLFGDGPGVDAVRPVGDYRLGFFVRLAGLRFDYTHLRRSPEIDGEGEFAGVYDNYGSAALTWTPWSGDPLPGFFSCAVDAGRALFDGLVVEVGMGTDLNDGEEAGAEESHAVHVAVGARLGGSLSDLDLTVEMAGAGREFGPSSPLGGHLDRLLYTRMIGLRWRPFGGRVGPGVVSLRTGYGRAYMELELTPGDPGPRPDGACPAGFDFDDPREGRYCVQEQDGDALQMGIGYGILLGRDFAFNTDLSLSRLDLEDPREVLGLTFGIRYAPSEG